MHKRPVDLNLFRQHWPLSAWVSILHRITGVVMFLALPVFLFLLQRSLDHQSGFEEVSDMLGGPAGRLMLLVVIASLAHHLLAGLRHLAMDIHWGVQKDSAQRSARGVVIASALIALLAAWGLFL